MYHETWFGPKTVGHVEFRSCIDLSSIQVSEDKSIHVVHYRSFLIGLFQVLSVHWMRFLKMLLVCRPFRHTFLIIGVSQDERAVCWLFRICRRHILHLYWNKTFRLKKIVMMEREILTSRKRRNRLQRTSHKYFCQNEKLTKQASFLSHYRKDETISIHTSKSVLEYSYYHIISPWTTPA